MNWLAVAVSAVVSLAVSLPLNLWLERRKRRGR